MDSAITSHLNEHVTDYLTCLERLVNIDCGTRHKVGVDVAGTIVRDLLEARNWSVQIHPQTDYGDFLEARIAGSGQSRLMLLGHLDTVFPVGTVDERTMQVDGDYARGPGVVDMKAGILTGIFAVDALLEAGFDDFAEIVFFLNSEEEVGSPTSMPLYTEIAQDVDAVFVLEHANGGDIVSARKGRGEFQVQVHGRKAHAGLAPEDGANAIVELAHKIQALAALNAPDEGITVNVGVINGGMATNVVPDSAHANVDVRVLRASSAASIEQAIQALEATTSVAGTTVTITGSITHPPMEKTPATGFLVELAQQQAQQLEFTVADRLSGGTSDANPIAAWGVPVLDGLGPVGGHIHSPDEYLDITSVVPRTALLAGLIQALAVHREELYALRQ